ncbi:hypothetical protein LCGC14_1586830 [marine sediment metagenome]|uniref:Uncharacterized protein n=1 Tax=marine sediment metagenome TaxID=412755 RepID=A0A0F9IFH3_9ZZZZ
MDKICGYGFECPQHGLETVVFCFRAFDENAIDKWKKITTILNDLDQEQKNEVLRWVKEQKVSYRRDAEMMKHQFK